MFSEDVATTIISLSALVKLPEMEYNVCFISAQVLCYMYNLNQVESWMTQQLKKMVAEVCHAFTSACLYFTKLMADY